MRVVRVVIPYPLRRMRNLPFAVAGAPSSVREGGFFAPLSRVVIPNPPRRMRNLLFAVAFAGAYLFCVAIPSPVIS